MRKTRKCAFCGRKFTMNSGMQKYCCEKCAAEAKRERKKRTQDFMNAVGPLAELQGQEYFTFSKAAVLMGCTRQYIYKLVAQGKLKASRIGGRMSLVRKADIEAMLDASPYCRVLPFAKSKTADGCKAKANAGNRGKARAEESTEVPEYYSGEEVMAKFKVKQSWLYTSAKRNAVPMCRIAGKNYYSRRHIEELLGMAVDTAKIEEWLLPEEVEERYGMGRSALRAYAHRHGIPTKREYGRTYYSKEHLDSLRRTDLTGNADYCTVEEVQRIYGLSSANICHIVKVKNIGKVKVGVRNLLLKADVERVMAERTAQGLQ